MRLTLVSLLVKDQDEAARFYVDRLCFVVAEDNPMGDERWLLVRPTATPDVAISLTKAKTTEQLALVGRQAADQPLFGLGTDDCRRDYAAMKARGVVFEGEPQSMPFGSGVMLQDLYGNRLYLNEEPR